jgi:hypothetical protein
MRRTRFLRTDRRDRSSERTRVDALLARHPGDWVKIRSSNFKANDSTSFETHAYQNQSTGEIVEMKTKFQ